MSACVLEPSRGPPLGTGRPQRLGKAKFREVWSLATITQHGAHLGPAPQGCGAFLSYKPSSNAASFRKPSQPPRPKEWAPSVPSLCLPGLGVILSVCVT